MDKKKLNQTITELARAAWDAEKRPILLSTLGTQDGGDIARAAKEHAQSLSKYIGDELAAEILLVRHSTNPVVVGIVPQNPETKSISEFDSILEICLSPQDQQNRFVRFHPIFWQAFRRPLLVGHKRYLTSGDKLKVEDIPEAEPQPEGAVEIEKEFLADSEGETSNEDIYKNIELWADKHALQSAQFSFGAVARRFRDHRILDSGSLLVRILESLDKDDLRRMNMPMDIIQKLASTKL